MDKQDIIDAVDEAFNKRRGVLTDEKHRIHHDFLEEMMIRRMKWERFWCAVRKTTIATVTVTVVGGTIAGLVWAGKVLWNAAVHLIIK